MAKENLELKANVDTDKVEATDIVVSTPTDVVDIDLSVIEKKTFRINGDNNRLIELNPSDISIVTRIEAADKEFAKCVEELQKLSDFNTDTDEEIYELGKRFKEIDSRMRQLLDDIFQSNVSEVCTPEGSGSMYDPINGKYRYEHIIEALMTFYESNIQSEFKKMTKAVNAKTAKYTRKR